MFSEEGPTIRSKVERAIGLETGEPYRWKEDSRILFVLFPGIAGLFLAFDWWLGWAFADTTIKHFTRWGLTFAATYLAFRTRRRPWVWFLVACVSPIVAAVVLLGLNAHRFRRERLLPDGIGDFSDFNAATSSGETYTDLKGDELVSSREASSKEGWILTIVIAAIWGGSTLVYPGGLLPFVRDSLIEAFSNSETSELREQMSMLLTPVFASLTCVQTFDNHSDLKKAVYAYNSRNEQRGKELADEIEALGGMTKGEKQLVQRKASRSAKDLLGERNDMWDSCEMLSVRLNQGEFDL